MSSANNDFPERRRVYEGALLGSIVHAVMMGQYPDLSNEQSWDDDNYSVQNSSGARGTVTFKDDKLVGVFFDEDSPRNPANSDEEEYDLDRFFEGAPDDVFELAEDGALQYVLQDIADDEQAPIITTAFWSAGERLAAAEPWQQVMEHGAHLLRIQLLDTDAALAEWKEEFEMTDEQVALARSVYERKLAAPDQAITLTQEERDLILADAEEGGEKEARESFSELNITLP